MHSDRGREETSALISLSHEIFQFEHLCVIIITSDVMIIQLRIDMRKEIAFSSKCDID